MLASLPFQFAAMATVGLLHHHLHHRYPRPPFHLPEFPYLLYRKSTLLRPPFSSRSVPSLMHKEPAVVVCAERVGGVPHCQPAPGDGGDAEVVDWVNKAAHDPMVEVDPVTVFRRILAERRASLAMVIAKQEEGLVQNTLPPPSFFGIRRPSNSAVGIAVALVLLVVAGVQYFLRKKDDGSKLTSTAGTENLENSINGTRKLVKDTIKAPDSILTAMAIGAASLGRHKGYMKSEYETASTAADSIGNENQKLEGEAQSTSISNAVFAKNIKSDSNALDQQPSDANVVDDFVPFKVQNVGVDLTEGPWFSQASVDTAKQTLVEKEELECETVLIQSQGLQFSNQTTTFSVAEQSVTDISVADVQFKFPTASEVVDGEFFGELSINATPEQLAEPPCDTVQKHSLKSGEFLNDNYLPGSDNSIVEKLEQMLNQDSVESRLEDITGLDQTLVPTIENLNVQIERESDTEASESNSDTDCDKTDEYYHSYFTGIKEQKNAESSFSGVDQALGRAEQESSDIQHGVSLSCDATQIARVEEGVAIAADFSNQYLTGGEYEEEQSLDDGRVSSDQIPYQDSAGEMQCLASDAEVEAPDGVSRHDGIKALEATIPAIAIGVGTVGALLGVAGGLQVVGFAALASFVSQDFFWAQSRESLWEELNGITDRQKLLEFLARRNIMRKEQEKSSL